MTNSIFLCMCVHTLARNQNLRYISSTLEYNLQQFIYNCYTLRYNSPSYVPMKFQSMKNSRLDTSDHRTFLAIFKKIIYNSNILNNASPKCNYYSLRFSPFIFFLSPFVARWILLIKRTVTLKWNVVLAIIIEVMKMVYWLVPITQTNSC